VSEVEDAADEATEGENVDKKPDEAMEYRQSDNKNKSTEEKRPNEDIQDSHDDPVEANSFEPTTQNPIPNQWVARRWITTRRVTVETTVEEYIAPLTRRVQQTDPRDISSTRAAGRRCGGPRDQQARRGSRSPSVEKDSDA
jgi:hypothetical protein